MFEQKAPNEVDPTERQTEEGHENGNDQGNDALRFQERRPSDEDLDDPVYDRNEQQNDLDEPALFVKPCSHK